MGNKPIMALFHYFSLWHYMYVANKGQRLQEAHGLGFRVLGFQVRV